MYENPFYNQSGFIQNSNTQVSNMKPDLDLSHFAGLNITESSIYNSFGKQTIKPAQFASPFIYQGNLDPTKPLTKSCYGSCNDGKGCDGQLNKIKCSSKSPTLSDFSCSICWHNDITAEQKLMCKKRCGLDIETNKLFGINSYLHYP